MRSSDKIWPIHKNIYGLKTGAAAHSQFVLRLTQNYISQFSTDLDYLPPVKSAARMASQFLYEYKSNNTLTNYYRLFTICLYCCWLGSIRRPSNIYCWYGRFSN